MLRIDVTLNNFVTTLPRSCTKYIAGLLAAVLLFGCAQPGKLTGGDKDETPPRILGSSPQNGAVNFDGTSIRMEFDEYVDIGGAAKALVVTPPFDQAPTFTLHNKEVTIEWEGELLDSTTYVFNFGEGIADVNERNPLDSNLFVFSTGSYIDSFEVHGRVVDAFTLQPVKDVTVMLYDNNIDSLPLTSLPRYFAKTDDQGKYAIGYLAAGKYEVFALETGNNGYTFDLPIERIAYRNERITAVSPIDTTAEAVDDLLLFLHADTIQFLKEKKQVEDKGLQFVFNLPVDAYTITELNGKDISQWIERWNTERDSVTYWFPAADDYDSLDLRIAYDDNLDTVRFFQPSKFAKPDKKKKDEGFQLKAKGGKIKYFQALELLSEVPLGHVDLSSGLLIEGEDSLELATLSKTMDLGITVTYDWKQGQTYKIFLADSALCSNYGQCNDTIRMTLKATSKEDYGELTVHHDLPDRGHGHVWQLLNKEGKAIREQQITAKASVNLLHIPIGKYQMRLVVDSNENGKWDPGDYRAKTFPEQVLFYEQDLEIKPNWVEEIEWKVEP